MWIEIASRIVLDVFWWGGGGLCDGGCGKRGEECDAPVVVLCERRMEPADFPKWGQLQIFTVAAVRNFEAWPIARLSQVGRPFASQGGRARNWLVDRRLPRRRVLSK